MARRKHFTYKKYDGDDRYSWAVFKKSEVKGLGSTIFYGEAEPFICGLDRTSAAHEADKLEKREEERLASQH